MKVIVTGGTGFIGSHLIKRLVKNGHEVTLAFTSTERKDYKTISKQHGFNLGTVDYIGKNEEHLNKIFERIMDS